MKWLIVVMLPWYMGDAPQIVEVAQTIEECEIAMIDHSQNLNQAVREYNLDGYPLVACLTDIRQVDTIGRGE